MNISDILKPEDVFIQLSATTKRGALRQLAEYGAAKIGCTIPDILQPLLAREDLGSTGIGQGIGLPHCALEDFDVPGQLIGIFASLAKPIDFDAIDHAPVDLIFMLIGSHQASALHLRTLANLARRFRDPSFCDALRNGRDQSVVFSILTHDDNA